MTQIIAEITRMKMKALRKSAKSSGGKNVSPADSADNRRNNADEDESSA